MKSIKVSIAAVVLSLIALPNATVKGQGTNKPQPTISAAMSMVTNGAVSVYRTNILYIDMVANVLACSDGLSADQERCIDKPWDCHFKGRIKTQIVTNWATVSYTTTTPTTSSLLYIPQQENQVGTIYSNTVAVIEFRGKEVPAVLESVKIGTIERSVAGGGAVMY